MPYEAPPDLARLSLAEVAEQIAARKLPPIDTWDPPDTGDSHMHIAADGRWFHEGGLIARAAMVRAFASLLRREGDGRYWLVTPHYKQSITVEDAAFVAVDMQAQDGALTFRLNTDELVIAGPENPLRAQGDAEIPAIYLAVRHGCEARLDRSTWLQLAGHALTEDGSLTAESLGAKFLLVST